MFLRMLSKIGVHRKEGIVTNKMDPYKIAALDEKTLEEIRQFERSLQQRTGYPVALVAYTHERDTRSTQA